MKKNNEQKKQMRGYVSPFCEVIGFEHDNILLAGSPPVKPNVDVEDTTEDDEDTDLSSAKRFGCWEPEW